LKTGYIAKKIKKNDIEIGYQKNKTKSINTKTKINDIGIDEKKEAKKTPTKKTTRKTSKKKSKKVESKEKKEV
jgi:hypothetical protein